MKLASTIIVMVYTTLFAVTGVQGAVVMTASEVSGAVVVFGGGTINTTDLFASGTITPLPGLTPSEPTLILGAGTSGDVTVDVYSSITAPADFGAGGFTGRDVGTGDAFGVGSTIPLDVLLVPNGYVSNTLLSASNTFQGQSIASLGMTPGVYVWTWGSGANADSFTLNIVPEPTSLAMFGLGCMGLIRRTRS